MKKLTEIFNKATVAKGETFEIALSDNRSSSGFGWEFAVVSGKARFLGEVSVPPPPVLNGHPHSAGEASLRRFLFKAEETGEIEIKADLKRSWERNPPLKSQTFKITVK